MKRLGIPVWVFLAASLAVCLSIFSIAKRHRVEAHNKAVCIAAEFETIESMSVSQGLTVDKGIENLKAAGLRGVVLSEETVGDLIGQSRAAFTTLQFGSERTTSLPQLIFTDPQTLARVEKALQIRFRTAMRQSSARGLVLTLPQISPILVRALAIGLNPTQVAIARRSKLAIIARCANPVGASASTVRDTLTWIHDDGAIAFLPVGDQVLGRRESIKTTTKVLHSLGLFYASPEFTKIGGDQNVLEDAKDIVIRLHSAQAAELDKLAATDAVERYGKAARERNMRILLVRPLSFAAERPLASFADFVKNIHLMILREGGDVGLPRPFTEPGIPKLFFPVLGLALAAVVWWAASLFTANRVIRLAGAAFLVLLGVACYVKTGQQAMAFLASCAFPVIAFDMLDRWRPKNVIAGFAVVSLISVCGGLAVAGMLNGLGYYVRADEFRAVKLSVFLPILVVGFMYFRSLVDWRHSLRSPITWGAAATAFILVAGLAVMIARTGNDSGVGVSGGETLMRNLLDRILFVRPRTKEFLIGHPFLVVGIGYLSTLKRGDSTGSNLGGWVAVMLMIGAMGQSDVVNTLTHLHIPVMLSLVRIGEGWVLGGIIGYIAWTVVTWIGTARLKPTETINA